MKLSELIGTCPILDVTGDCSLDITKICYDSRICEAGCLFVAVSGLTADGHDFINQAVSKGAVAVVHEREISLPSGITAVRVVDARRVLGTLGRNFYRDPSSELCLIGVSGTKGKTTITYLLESIFQAAGFSTGVLGTVNYRFGEKVMPAPNTTPESIEMQKILRQMADEGVNHIIAEVSSHAVDLRRVDDCAFDLGLFTNLAQDHLDYHLTMENYYQAKKRFFTEVIPEGGKGRSPQMIINADDPWGKRLISEVGKAGVLTYGIDNPSDVKAEKYTIAVHGLHAELTSPRGRMAVASKLIGKFNLYNILAAVAAALALHIEPETIKDGIGKLKSVPGRLEKVDAGIETEPVVFVDYAHTEDALRKVLENLTDFKKARIITVFGCGGDRDRGKRPLMGAAVAALSDIAIVTSDNPRTEDPLTIIAAIEEGISETVMTKVSPDDLTADRLKSYAVIPDRKKAIEKAVAIADPSDIVLIAGKGHEDYQIIGRQRLPFDDRLIAAKALARHYGRVMPP
ncbi:MAG: UDP-N-acetylmuramoyl-L-alanyl-D-glutamate--2,6-diaminopimelate ligase [Deltaproteobacteria bacterium]|nr:UDP-N-acetylmuramoyl-L-alanyl-D-glutamate--2,6-diaminopimelate ligase [Deltaproteobacteria bacterium]